MKLKVILTAIILVGSIHLLADDQSAKKMMTPEEREARRQMMMEKTGGMIDFPGEGKILYLNCQSAISEEEIKTRCDKIQYVLKYPCELRSGIWKFGDKRPEGCNIAIFIVNDDTLPMSLIAVEEGWGVVNTAQLKLPVRFSKELTRVTTLVCGAGYSPIKTSIMRGIAKPSDLDKYIDGFTMDMYNCINGNLKDRGMSAMRKSTYRKACEEGWAPMPKNNYQQKIWDETHKIPSEPIKIKYEMK